MRILLAIALTAATPTLIAGIQSTVPADSTRAASNRNEHQVRGQRMVDGATSSKVPESVNVSVVVVVSLPIVPLMVTDSL